MLTDIVNVLHQIVNMVTQKSCLRKIGISCLIWSVKSLQQLSPPYKMYAMMWMVGGSLSQPSVDAWMSLNTRSNASYWLMNIQKYQRSLQRERLMQGTLQRGSVPTRQLCLTWMRLVSTSPCAARMDTRLNTTTTQFEQQNNTLPLDMHLIVLFWLLYNHSASLSTNHRLPHHPQPFAILEMSFAVLEKRPPHTPTPKSHFLRPIRDFRKKTPTTQDLVFRLFTAFAIYEKSSQSFWKALYHQRQYIVFITGVFVSST